jgi:hypothetical protein
MSHFFGEAFYRCVPQIVALQGAEDSGKIDSVDI